MQCVSLNLRSQMTCFSSVAQSCLELKKLAQTPALLDL